jgi:hypothetical protein
LLCLFLALTGLSGTPSALIRTAQSESEPSSTPCMSIGENQLKFKNTMFVPVHRFKKPIGIFEVKYHCCGKPGYCFQMIP